jgi:ubiquinone/menaquinone biosynthesis C-methylase UbiE
MSNRADLPAGVCDIGFHQGRRTNRQLRYRLNRRTDEVEATLEKVLHPFPLRIVDIGTADALMLERLKKRWGKNVYLGIEYNGELLRSTRLTGIYKSEGDALFLPLKSSSCDVAIATAVIEHVDDADKMVLEVHRVLKTGGLFVVTSPNPTIDYLADKLGIWKDSVHQCTFTLVQLEKKLGESGFVILTSKKFMFSPVGFPAEKKFEKFLGPLGLSLLMANQLVVAKKVDA